VQHSNQLTGWKGLDPRFGRLLTLTGREGEGEGEGTGAQTASSGGEGSGTQAPNASTTGQEGNGSNQDSFDRSYVEKLRAEAADWRTKYQSLEKEKAEREKAEMSEVERLRVEKEEAEAKIQAAEQLLLTERKRAAIVAMAGQLKFRDPADAIAHISLDDITMNQDGTPHKGSVEAAVKKIAEAKKYLISGAGDADGGSRGNNPPPDSEQLKRYEQELADMGGVKVDY
jgi:hypothetical protein